MKDLASDNAKTYFEILRSRNFLTYSGKENEYTVF